MPMEPIACTLTPGGYAARTGELAALAARALRARHPTADGERLVFDDTPETERQLRAVIAAEASCCAFLSMDLTRTGEALVLDIAGPEEARPIIAELFAGVRCGSSGPDDARAGRPDDSASHPPGGSVLSAT
jgi:hypothetical protein